MLANPLCVSVGVLNKAICNEDMLANPLCVSVGVLNKAICNEDMLANPLCVSVGVLNKAICNEDMLANPLCVSVGVLNKAICNEDMLANPLCVSVGDLNKAICNEDMLANPLCVTAGVLNNAVSDECLRMYKGLGFLRLPRYPMLVDGTMIDFMVDSGAARSTIRPYDLPCEPKLMDLVFESTSASGHTISENYTVPLKCETEGGRALKHAFLLTSVNGQGSNV